MPGLVPGIHVLAATKALAAKNNVDRGGKLEP
jgi:hypothetical protein